MTNKNNTLITAVISLAVFLVNLHPLYAQSPSSKNSSNVLRDQKSKTEIGSSAEKRITIVYHLNEEIRQDNNKVFYSSQLINEIIYGFPEIENIKLIAWKDEGSFLDKTDEEILSKLYVDGYFDLNINFKKDEFVSVSPRFVFKDKATLKLTSLDLSIYAMDYYRNITFSSFVISEFSGFLTSFFTHNGGDAGSYKMGSESRDAMLTLADTASARGDFFKSNYIVYNLMAQKKDMDASSAMMMYNMLGQNKYDEYRMEEAEEEFNKVLVLDPINPDANAGLALMMLDFNDYEGALNQLKSLPPSDQVYFLQGQAFYGLGEFGTAKDLLEKCQSLSKDDQYLQLVILGAIYLETNDTQKALLVYRNLYSNYSKNADIRYLYGYALTKTGINEYENNNYRAAIDFLLKAQQINNTADIANYLRLAYIYDGKYQDAINLIEEEVKSGNYSTDHIYLTHALDLREKFIKPENAVDTVLAGRVIESLNIHIGFNPGDPYGYYYKGNTLTRLGKGPEGLALMEQSFNLDSVSISAQLDLMELYLLNDKFQACEDFFNRVNTINKSDKEIVVTDRDQAIMNYLVITSLKIQKKDYEKYLTKLNKLFDKNTDINFWDYNSYRCWLAKADLDEETKAFLEDLTDEMEQHDETTRNKLAESDGLKKL